jgi:hypothetical protein
MFAICAIVLGLMLALLTFTLQVVDYKVKAIVGKVWKKMGRRNQIQNNPGKSKPATLPGDSPESRKFSPVS